MAEYTILIAHPDDEILWMWPALDHAKKIICVSSDRNNPNRVWCRERRLCLEELGRQLHVKVKCFDYNSEFYRLSTRDGQLKALAETVMKEIKGPVFTHNAWGEYGHIDHILCHYFAKHSGFDVHTTDIAIESNWLPVHPAIRYENRLSMTDRLYKGMKAIYDARGCWTWSHPPVLECGIGKS